MNCSELTQGLVAAQCNHSSTAGLEDDVILINFNDVDKSLSQVTDNVITSLITNKKGFEFSTYGRSMDDTGVTFTKGTYKNTWSHSLVLRLFTKSENSKKFVNEFAAGAKVIAVVKNKEAGTDNNMTYEVYGWDNGLEMSESTSTVAMADGVVYEIKLSSSDSAQEGSLPKTVKAATGTTEAMLESLYDKNA